MTVFSYLCNMKQDWNHFLELINKSSMKRIMILTAIWVLAPIIITSIYNMNQVAYDCYENKDEVIEKILQCKKQEFDADIKEKEIALESYKIDKRNDLEKFKDMLSEDGFSLDNEKIVILKDKILGRVQSDPDCITLVQQTMCKIIK